MVANAADYVVDSVGDLKADIWTTIEADPEILNAFFKTDWVASTSSLDREILNTAFLPAYLGSNNSDYFFDFSNLSDTIAIEQIVYVKDDPDLELVDILNTTVEFSTPKHFVSFSKFGTEHVFSVASMIGNTPPTDVDFLDADGNQIPSPFDRFVHLVFNFDPSTQTYTLYIDGQIKGTVTATESADYYRSGQFLGVMKYVTNSVLSSDPLDGVYGFAVYDTALNPIEINTRYNALASQIADSDGDGVLDAFDLDVNGDGLNDLEYAAALEKIRLHAAGEAGASPPQVEDYEAIGVVNTSTHRLQINDWLQDANVLAPESIQSLVNSINYFEDTTTTVDAPELSDYQNMGVASVTSANLQSINTQLNLIRPVNLVRFKTSSINRNSAQQAATVTPKTRGRMCWIRR